MLRKKIKEYSIKYLFIKILLFLFLVSSSLSASHIHHDDADHEAECEVCIVLNNFHSADLPSSTVTIPELGHFFDAIMLPENYRLTHHSKGYYSTAPPVS